MNKIYEVATSLQKFYSSKNAIIFFLSLQTIAVLIQIILFATGNIIINGISVGDEREWIVWFITTISFIGAVCMVITNILVTRENKMFIVTNLIGMSFSIINSIFSRSLMIVITMIMTMILVVHRYVLWNKENVEDNNLKQYTSKTYIKILAAWIAWLIIGLLIVGFWGQEIYDPNYTGMRPEWTWWLDAVGSSSIVLSMLLITCKNKYGFLAQSIGTFTGVIIFISLGQIVMCLSLLISCAMAATAFMAWVGRDWVNKEKEHNN